MPLRSPDDTVLKGVCMPRWVKDWYSDNRIINCSGLIQECLIKVIQENDPEYFEVNKKFLPDNKRKENMPKVPII